MNRLSRRHALSLRDGWDLHKKTHHERGQLVIWTADTNNPGYDQATGQASERKLFANSIDRINWLPGTGPCSSTATRRGSRCSGSGGPDTQRWGPGDPRPHH
jgi:hypothetical protein